MATGIRDKVAVLGMGCSKFGERWESSAEDLMVEAFQEALADAGIEKKEIQAAWFGTHIDEVNVGKSGVPLATTLKLPFIPVTRTENYCATGTEAFRGACYAVAAGVYDFCLALGVEKLKDTGYGGLPATAGLRPVPGLDRPERHGPGHVRPAGHELFRQATGSTRRSGRRPWRTSRPRATPTAPEPQGAPAPAGFRRADHQRAHDRLSAGALRLLRGERRVGRGDRDDAGDRPLPQEDGPGSGEGPGDQRLLRGGGHVQHLGRGPSGNHRPGGADGLYRRRGSRTPGRRSA